jgi:hypothetical protein
MPALLNEMHSLIADHGKAYRFAPSGSSSRKLKRLDVNLPPWHGEGKAASPFGLRCAAGIRLPPSLARLAPVSAEAMWSHGVLSHLTADLRLPLQIGTYNLDGMPFTTGNRENSMKTSAHDYETGRDRFLSRPSVPPPASNRRFLTVLSSKR